MFAPDVAAGSDRVIFPGTASLKLKTSYPIVNGQVRSRKYYIDTSANVYWVTNESIGLVEKI